MSTKEAPKSNSGSDCVVRFAAALSQMALTSNIRAAVRKVEPRNLIVASAGEGVRPVCPACSVRTQSAFGQWNCISQPISVSGAIAPRKKQRACVVICLSPERRCPTSLRFRWNVASYFEDETIGPSNRGGRNSRETEAS
jgi:hypothetical protein